MARLPVIYQKSSNRSQDNPILEGLTGLMSGLSQQANAQREREEAQREQENVSQILQTMFDYDKATADAYANLPAQTRNSLLQYHTRQQKETAKLQKEQQDKETHANYLINKGWSPEDAWAHVNLPKDVQKEEIKAHKQKGERSWLGKLIAEPFVGKPKHLYDTKPRNGVASTEALKPLIEAGRAHGMSDEQIMKMIEDVQGEPQEEFSGKRAGQSAATAAAGGGIIGLLSQLNPAFAIPTAYDFVTNYINNLSKEAGGPKKIAPQTHDIKSALSSALQQPAQMAEKGTEGIPEPLRLFQKFAGGNPLSNLALGDYFASPETAAQFGKALENFPTTAGDISQLLTQALGLEGPQNEEEQAFANLGGLAGFMGAGAPATVPGLLGAAGKAALGAGAHYGTKKITGSDVLADTAMLGSLLGAERYHKGAFQEKVNEAYDKFDKLLDKEDKYAPIDKEVVEKGLEPVEAKQELGNINSKPKKFIQEQLDGVKNALEKKTMPIEPVLELEKELRDMSRIPEYEARQFNSLKDVQAFEKEMDTFKDLSKDFKSTLKDIMQAWKKNGKKDSVPLDAIQKDLDILEHKLLTAEHVPEAMLDFYDKLIDSIERKPGNIQDLYNVRRDLTKESTHQMAQKLQVMDDYHALLDAVDQGIEKWGEGNPEALKQWKYAKGLSKALKDTKLVAQNLHKKFSNSRGIMRQFYNLALHPLIKGLQGVDRLLKHYPHMSTLYKEFIQGIVSGSKKDIQRLGVALYKEIKKRDPRLYELLRTTKSTPISGST